MEMVLGVSFKQTQISDGAQNGLPCLLITPTPPTNTHTHTNPQSCKHESRQVFVGQFLLLLLHTFTAIFCWVHKTSSCQLGRREIGRGPIKMLPPLVNAPWTFTRPSTKCMLSAWLRGTSSCGGATRFVVLLLLFCVVEYLFLWTSCSMWRLLLCYKGAIPLLLSSEWHFCSGFKRRAPRAIKAVRQFAQKEMGTTDVRIDTNLNKFLWSKGNWSC